MSKRDAWRSQAITQDSQLIGRRLWALARDGERYRLTNIAHNTEENWPRGVYEADCLRWKSHNDRWAPSPAPECGCGLYAYWSLEDLTNQWASHVGSMTGIVMAWGRVLPGTNGFLAQYMMPVALDWPRCVASTQSPGYQGGEPPWAANSDTCGRPAREIRCDGASFTDYPLPYDEDYAVGYEWADMRCSRLHPLCEKHLRESEWLRADPQTERMFWIDVETCMTDLERWYEVEVLPPGEALLGKEARTELKAYLDQIEIEKKRKEK